jgi:sporulation protein YlmC with PRC-barrel domain
MLTTKILVAATMIGIAPVGSAQTPGKANLEAAEMAAELMGAPVFAADGQEVGEVADIGFDEEGQVEKIRIVTGAALGLGPRTIDLTKGSFITLRGAVVLEMPADVLQALPQVSEREAEK